MNQQDIQNLPPYVVFEKRAVEDRAKELSAGVYGVKDVDFVKVTRPGQRDTVEKEAEAWVSELEKKARDNLAPQSWADHFRKQYEAWKLGQELPLNGTPIKGWQLLSPAQQQNLITFGIRTVEDLAGASDEAIQRLGMGAMSLKQKAANWLSEGKDKGASAARMTALEIENKELRDKLEALLGEVQLMRKAQEGKKAA